MRQGFTINDFIENRWGEAKAELCHRDPSFVSSLQAYGNLLNRGFALPDNISVPSKRLPHKWHQLLETTMDVVQEVERLRLTVSLLEGQDRLRMARYHFETWVQSIYNLCDKVKVLVTQCCKLYQLGNKPKADYRSQVEERVQQVLGKIRQPLVHGAGGRGVTGTAITERGLWEVGIVMGPGIITVGLDYAYQGGLRPDQLAPQRYYALVEQMTKTIFTRLGEILYQLDQDISQAGGEQES